MHKKPLVSVIIPAYNRPNTLSRAIDSVLNQTYENIEIIVVDDNNENSEYRKETEKCMQKYESNCKLRYLKHKHNKNGAAARNTGISNSNGDYVAFLDDDDEFMPKKLDLQVNKLEKLDESWGAIYTGFIIKKENKVLLMSQALFEGNFKTKVLLMGFNIGSTSTLLVRKKVLDELNGFDESFKRHQDWEFLIRFFRKYKLAAINDILTIIHQNGMNWPKGASLEETKMKYLKSFREDIISLPIEIQNEVYKKHLLEIARTYFKERKFLKGRYFLKEAEKSSTIRTKEKLAIILSLIEGFIPVKDKISIVSTRIKITLGL